MGAVAQRLPETFRTHVKSSNIKYIAWDGKTLEVGYHNDTYQYIGVSPRVYENLLAAQSVGKFMSNIKDMYQFIKLEE